MRPNRVKRKLQAGETVVGCFANFPSVEAVEICGYAGFDFVMIDAEHGTITTESAYHMVLAAEASGTVPLIRVPVNAQDVILRHMDIGAAGVMVPQVNSVEEAQRVVQSVKYHPHGQRGLASVRASGFGIPQSLPNYVKAANDETMVIVQLENISTVERVTDILQVPGIDVLFVGPSDLAHSMGYPGEREHPEVLRVIEQICEMCAGSDVALGTIAANATEVNRLIDQGFRMIAPNAAGLLAAASRQLLADVRR